MMICCTSSANIIRISFIGFGLFIGYSFLCLYGLYAAFCQFQEYAQFLDYVRRFEGTHVTLEDLRQMAADVMRYSDPDTYS